MLTKWIDEQYSQLYLRDLNTESKDALTSFEE